MRMQKRTATRESTLCNKYEDIVAVKHKYRPHRNTNIYGIKVSENAEKRKKRRPLAQGMGDFINLSNVGGPSPSVTSVQVLPSSIHSLYSFCGRLLA